MSRTIRIKPAKALYYRCKELLRMDKYGADVIDGVDRTMRKSYREISYDAREEMIAKCRRRTNNKRIVRNELNNLEE